ncbi:MAG: type II toxin-antitoxin system RelE/ParE family toxin [Campylobacterota bacterium]|nr:type II toxin-antitoxin system RelE/ParE family toxin [Campylobacterota bacterium]
MQIIRGDNYLRSLQKIMDFIAKDSINRAFEFQDSLDKHIDFLDDMPYKCRQSIYFDDVNIRDYIFMGYAIPYKVDKKNNAIKIIGIRKYHN